MKYAYRTTFYSFLIQLASIVCIVSALNMSTSSFVHAQETFPPIEDFEDGLGGWTTENGIWEVGPSDVVPPSPGSGNNVAGTILNGNYSANANGLLISPPIFLADDLLENEAYLVQFWHWFQTQDCCDRGTFQVSIVGNDSWVPLSSSSGDGRVWSKQTHDLSGYAGQTIQLGFLFTSNEGGIVDDGWFIDDVTIEKRSYIYNPFETFEAGVGDWSTRNGLWEVGTSSRVPESPGSGGSMAGTVMEGNYPADANARFVSPPIFLTDDLGLDEKYLLQFWQWFQTQDCCDRGRLEISADSGITWTSLASNGGDGRVWSKQTHDLSGYAGQTIQLGFLFTSNEGGIVDDGWFIDDVTIEKRSYIYNPFETFEAGVGDWSTRNGLWEVGTSSRVPESPGSGGSMAGTVMEGNYPADANARFVSPPIFLTDDLGLDEKYLLQFWQWFQTQDCCDRGRLEISADSGITWTSLASNGGDGRVWSKQTHDLSGYAGQTIQLGFLFTSNEGGIVDDGWFIDDVTIEKRSYIYNPFETFEAGVGDWSTRNGLWEVGTSSRVPESPGSGGSMAGTVMEGNYPADANARFVSPPIFLTDDLGLDEKYLLQFWQWFQTQDCCDRGRLEISADSGITWTSLASNGGDGRVWSKQTHDLSGYAGQTIQLGFLFTSNEGGIVDDGWFIDDVTIEKRSYIYNPFETFEAGVGDWSTRNGLWEVGTSSRVPESPGSGGSMAGTVMEGNYPADANARFVSPPIFLTDDLGLDEKYLLQFWQWFQTQDCCDRGRLEISADSGITWTSLASNGGDGRVWSKQTHDLSGYAGQTIQLGFLFTSNEGGIVDDGWFIDDVTIEKRSYIYNPFETFEAGVGDWSTRNGLWEVGTSSRVPESPGSGGSMAGTVMEGNYPADANARFVMPPIVLSTPTNPGDSYQLKFLHFYRTQSCCDFATVQISADSGNTWVDLIQYSGNTNEWTPDSLDLSPYIGDTIQVGFLFTSNEGGIVDIGWYLDDVFVEGYVPDQGPIIGVTPIPPAPQDTFVTIVHEDILIVSNSGGSTLRITDMPLSGSDADAFAVDPTVADIEPGNSLEFTISFNPTKEGAHSAEINIESNAIAGESTVVLSGTGVRPGIVLTPDPSPSVGNSLSFNITTPPDTYTPDAGMLFYRITRTGAYDSTAIDLQVRPFTAMIPDSLVTALGIEYFVRFTDNDVVFLDGTNMFTSPAVSPELNPHYLSVEVPRFVFPWPVEPRQLSMISIPLVLQEPEVVNVLGNDFGSDYDFLQWRIHRWSPEQGAYVEVPDQSFARGVAYWLNTREGGEFDIVDAQSTPVDPFPIELQPGWNQIGNPFAFTVEWSSITGTDAVGQPVAFDADSRVYMYNQTTLEPWVGYFVFNPTANPVTITVEPDDATTSINKRPVQVAKQSDQAVKRSDSAELRLQFMATLTESGLADTQNFLGFMEGAETGVDAKDFAEAPSFGNAIRLSIVENGIRFAGNFKPFSEEGQFWDAEVEIARPNDPFLTRERVEVRFVQEGQLPQGFEVFVIDESRQKMVVVRDQRFYLDIDEHVSVPKLRLIVGTRDFAEQSTTISLAPVEFALEQNFPNPFRGKTTFDYQLSEAGPVKLQVFNTLGQLVATIVDAHQEAGVYRLPWDARSAAGMLSSGTYIYRLQAGGQSLHRSMTLVR